MHGHLGSEETCSSRAAVGSTRSVPSELKPARSSTRGSLGVQHARAGRNNEDTQAECTEPIRAASKLWFLFLRPVSGSVGPPNKRVTPCATLYTNSGAVVSRTFNTPRCRTQNTSMAVGHAGHRRRDRGGHFTSGKPAPVKLKCKKQAQAHTGIHTENCWHMNPRLDMR